MQAKKPIPTQQLRRHHIEAGILLSAMFIGCQLLWLGVPALSLWALSWIVTSASAYLLASFVIVPSALAAFAALLALANRRYLAISSPPMEDDEESPRLRGPLESMLPGSIVLAAIALAIWIVLVADHCVPGVGLGAW